MLHAPRIVRDLFRQFLAAKRACPADPPLRESGVVLAALMTHAILQRESRNRTTTLRQLHLVLGVSQPSALRIAHLLEREGVIAIDTDMSDRFESTVRLTNTTRERFSHAHANILLGEIS